MGRNRIQPGRGFAALIRHACHIKGPITRQKGASPPRLEPQEKPVFQEVGLDLPKRGFEQFGVDPKFKLHPLPETRPLLTLKGGGKERI